MIKKITFAKFESNLLRELDLISEDKVNQLIIKRPKGKGNIVLISEA
jgi:hypothetical protein